MDKYKNRSTLECTETCHLEVIDLRFINKDLTKNSTEKVANQKSYSYFFV